MTKTYHHILYKGSYQDFVQVRDLVNPPSQIYESNLGHLLTEDELKQLLRRQREEGRKNENIN